MHTYITTAHEEQYSDGSRTLGMLLNYEINGEENGGEMGNKESFVYIYREGMYIFFNTMVDLFDYLLYGEDKMKRAYMTEEEFDTHYDNPIDGKFSDKLKWS
jgi:hypothetical protein